MAGVCSSVTPAGSVSDSLPYGGGLGDKIRRACGWTASLGGLCSARLLAHFLKTESEEVKEKKSQEARRYRRVKGLIFLDNHGCAAEKNEKRNGKSNKKYLRNKVDSLPAWIL